MQLEDQLTDHFRLTAGQKAALKRLGLLTVRDLLFYFPARYENIANRAHVKELKKGDRAIVYGTLSGLKAKKTFRTRKVIAEGYITDETGKIKIQWFNQPYMASMYHDGEKVRLAGTVTGKTSLYISNPEVSRMDEIADEVDTPLFKESSGEPARAGHAGGPLLYPVYPETRGITSKWMYHHVQKIFAERLHEAISDPIPEIILKKYNLPEYARAFIWMHTPKSERSAEAARKRFAFEEVFFIQLAKQQERYQNEHRKTLSIDVAEEDIDKFVGRFPFTLTGSQEHAIKAISDDLRRTYPMSRLLEGDVGSGKTAVAAATIYGTVMTHPDGKDFGNLQAAYMVPTEILAKQHFESFIEYFAHLPVQVGLITGSGCKKFPSKVDPTKATDISRAQLLKWVANGEIPILIGTHALIQKTVAFKNLAYVIIDEQHRFGTAQRQRLARKDGMVPHLLSMTATPIPRTLALTIYGDLDLTLLDEMPHGRKPIITEIVTPDGREAMYTKARSELDAGRQVYVICPRIDLPAPQEPSRQAGEPDPGKLQALNTKSVKEEARRLKKDVFKDYEIDILHSKMKTAEKDAVMERFAEGEVQILVATSVVEVGVNVPNATVIIIEGSDRFGLAQLHQLRGRVIRSNHQAYCFALAETKAQASAGRLRALKTAKNGFALAEEDLKLRGAGELYGKKQWGISDIGMEAIKNLKMVEAARDEARQMIGLDPELKRSPQLKETVSERMEHLHFE